jgi:hypothetical protein
MSAGGAARLFRGDTELAERQIERSDHGDFVVVGDGVGTWVVGTFVGVDVGAGVLVGVGTSVGVRLGIGFGNAMMKPTRWPSASTVVSDFYTALWTLPLDWASLRRPGHHGYSGSRHGAHK